MSFNLQVRLDPSQTVGAIAQIGGKLDNLETKGKQTGASLTKSFDGSIMANTAKAFDGLTAAIKREQDILDRIRGPAKAYMADLQALDHLLEMNTISTAEYAAQITQMNQKMKEVHETGSASPQPSLSSGASALYAGLAGGGAAAGVIALGQGLENLLAESHKLSNEYVTLTNNLQKFEDATHGSAAVMAQQEELAKALHTTMQQSLQTYDGVQDALNDMNLSSSQLARVTQTIGEAATIANRPLESAGDLMNRLVLAMDSGAGSGRALKSIMVQIPELAQLWEAAFKTDEAGLLSLANRGKLTAQDLIGAMTTQTQALDEAMAHRKLTTDQEMAMIKEQANIYYQQGFAYSDAIQMAGNAEYAMHKKNERALHDSGFAAQQALDAVQVAASKAADSVKDVANEQRKNEVNALAQEYKGFISVLDQIENAFARLDQLVEDTWGENGDGILAKIIPAGTKISMEYAHSLGEAKKQLAELNAAHAAGNIVGEAYRQKYEALITTINGGLLPAEISLMHQINKPWEDFERNVAALNRLFEDGTISLRTYDAMITKLTNDLPKSYELPAQSVVNQGFGAFPTPYADVEKMSVPSVKSVEQASYAAEVQKEYDERMAQALTRHWDTELKQLDEKWKTEMGLMSEAVKPLNDALEQMFETGNFGLDEFGRNFEKTLDQIAYKVALTGLLGLFTGNQQTIGALGGIPNLFGGSANGSETTIPHAASGLSGYIGGYGGTDSKLFASWVTPGEHVSIKTPEQMAAAQQQAQAPVVHNQNIIQINPRDLLAVMQSGAGQRQTMETIRLNASAIKAMLK